ncbi:MAG TPA: CvpA family protein, partial [Caldimonas sp.]|nr:CvpA family protein [Caldimonas sp.]
WLPIGWVDIAMLGVVALSAVVGLWRGLTFELLSLAGWFAAYFGASWLVPWLAPHLPIGAPGSALNHGVAFASAFLAVLILWSLLSRAIAALVGATPLRPLDRLLGAVFGVARAGVVLLAAATLVSFTPFSATAAWRQSSGAAMLGEALHRWLPRLTGDEAVPARRV